MLASWLVIQQLLFLFPSRSIFKYLNFSILIVTSICSWKKRLTFFFSKENKKWSSGNRNISILSYSIRAFNICIHAFEDRIKDQTHLHLTLKGGNEMKEKTLILKKLSELFKYIWVRYSMLLSVITCSVTGDLSRGSFSLFRNWGTGGFHDFLAYSSTYTIMLKVKNNAGSFKLIFMNLYLLCLHGYFCSLVVDLHFHRFTSFMSIFKIRESV